MIELWPWLVMGAGVSALFIYGIFGARSRHLIDHNHIVKYAQRIDSEIILGERKDDFQSVAAARESILLRRLEIEKRLHALKADLEAKENEQRIIYNTAGMPVGVMERDSNPSLHEPPTAKPKPEGLPKKKRGPSTISSFLASSHKWMPVVLSVLVLLSALYVILSRETYPDAQQKWAFGVVGTVLGYWFKR